MADISEVESGYDIEFLMSEDYIKHFLLVSFETGTLPSLIPDENEDGYDILIHPPAELAEKLLYDPHTEYVMNPYIDLNGDYAFDPGSFDVKIMHDSTRVDLEMSIVVSTINKERYRAGLPSGSAQIPMKLHLKFRILSDTDADGFQTNVRLLIEVYDIGGVAIDVLTGLTDPVTNEPYSETDLLHKIREKVNREIPLDFIGKDAGVEKIDTKKFGPDEDHPAAFGIYMNFKLRNGRDRNDYLIRPFLQSQVIRARNFLQTGQNFAFAFKGDLYQKITDDMYFRQFPDDGNFYFNPPLMVDGKK